MKPPSSSAAVTTTLFRGGMKHLQEFFRKERDRFTSSPILLLVHHYPSDHLQQAQTHSLTIPQHDKLQINTIQQVQYMLQQKLGYQTFVATCGNTTNSSSSSSLYYPTLVDIENAMKLSQRIGAYNIVAIGPGNVMDVGKAMYQTHDLMDELVLIPTTYTASMVSTSTHSLLYDTPEDTLIPQPSYSSSSSSLRRHKSIFSMDDMDYDVTTSLFDTITNRHVTLWALLSIVLDHIYQDIHIPVLWQQHNTIASLSSQIPNTNHQKNYKYVDDSLQQPPPPHSPLSSLNIPNEYLRIIDSIISCLDYKSPATTSTTSTLSASSSSSLPEEHRKILNLCYEVGHCISYGLPVTGDEDELIQPRTLPIAMVASLSSKASNISFSQYTAPTIMASFVLSYCDLILEKIQTKNRYTNTDSTRNEKHLIRLVEMIIQKEKDGVYQIPKIISTESILSFMSTIQTNQMIWNCHANSYYDGSIDVPKLFRRHLLI